MSEPERVNYVAERTASAFHKSDALIRGERGPIGAGKSVTCCTEIMRRAVEQAPFMGVRKTRFGIVRNTYGELKTTTIKTWVDWYGSVTKIVYGHPIMGLMKFPLEDGTRVESELIFISLDRPEHVKKLKSIEFTGMFLNEAGELPEEVLHMATGRIGRYPSMRQGGPTWIGIIMDTNSPDVDNWWYEKETNCPEGYEFFVQPPALIRYTDPETGKIGYEPNPEAENTANLPGGYEYYLRQIPGKPQEWVNVLILNRFGSLRAGQKVYEDYGTHNHTDRVFDPGLGVIIWSHDFNFTPLSSVIMQKQGDTVYAVDEIVLTSSVATQAALEFCERYKDHKSCLVQIYGDASGHVGEKHGQASDFINLERILKANGFRVQMKVPRANPSIKDGQNSLRAKICDAAGNRTFFVNPAKCKMLDKGLSALKCKEGSTFQEENAEFQHITTAVRYYTAVEFPIKKREFGGFDMYGGRR